MDQEIVLPDEIDPSQKQWYAKYVKQRNAPKPADMLLNTDGEPDLKDGFHPCSMKPCYDPSQGQCD